MTLASPDPKFAECKQIVKRMVDGLLMPFFGAGVNMTDRPDRYIYVPGGKYLPNAYELSEELRNEFDCGLTNPCDSTRPHTTGVRCKWKEQSLLQVSWYVSTKRGQDALYHHLQKRFATGSPNSVHEFFAGFRQKLAKKGYNVPAPLIVTTNYDQLLERAFRKAGEPYDVFSFTIDHQGVGGFTHTPHGGDEAIPIKTSGKYNPDIKHAIILKIHGTAHPTEWKESTFVITEDDYIDYAAFVDVKKNIPLVLLDRMTDSRFLYLGYSLSDWNFRVLLRAIKALSRFKKAPSWAIMHQRDDWDELYWKEHDVEILQMRLEDYIKYLNDIVDGMPPSPGF